MIERPKGTNRVIQILTLALIFHLFLASTGQAQQEDMEKAKVLTQQAFEFYQQGQYAKAIPFA